MEQGRGGALASKCVSVNNRLRPVPGWGGERQLRMRGGWLRGGEPRGRGCATYAISEIPRLRDPGSPTLGATPLPAWRPSRDRPGVEEAGMLVTSAFSLGWRGNCRSE